MEKSIILKNDFTDIMKSTMISILISLLFVLIFALIIRTFSLESQYIMPVNIAIKIISLSLGVILGFKHKQNGFMKGFFTGLLFMLLSFLIFASIVAFKDVKFNVIDLVTLPFIGSFAGILAVNIKGIKLKKFRRKN